MYCLCIRLLKSMENQNRRIENKIWQNKNTLSRNKQIVLNFYGHPLGNQWFPDNFTIIELPMQVNIQAVDADKIIAEHIVKKLEVETITNLNFIPIIVLPSYKPLIAPLIYIVTQLFGGKLPVIANQMTDVDENLTEAKYLMSSVIRTRIRPLRPEYTISNDALIIN
jgi:hypothetical protein